MNQQSEMYAALTEYLGKYKLKATPSHTSSGEEIIEVDNLGLMIFVEVYDRDNGEHDVVPLRDLVDKIVNWDS